MTEFNPYIGSNLGVLNGEIKALEDDIKIYNEALTKATGSNNQDDIQQVEDILNGLDVKKVQLEEAIAFAAQDVPDGYSLRTLVREYLARPYAMLDVFVLRPQPEKGNWPRK